MPYTPHKPQPPETPEQLRARIPGWGVDLDPKDRPSVPRERFDPDATGAHWEFPERQPETVPRERSVEHQFLTPVFGTSAPLKWCSGRIRRMAYRLGEDRAARWLILLGADRVDAWENHLASFMTLRPDNPVTQTGVTSEFSQHGVSSRAGQQRADVRHHWMDPIIVAGPWVVGAGAAVALGLKAAARFRDR